MDFFVINCAFIQRDISDLVQSAVDIEAGIIDFPKRKTAIERRVPLWKQTLDALRYVDTTSNSDDRFFHTTTGQVLVVDHSNDSRSDAVHGAFERLQNKFGIKKGRSAGSVHRGTLLEQSPMKPAIFLQF